MYKLYITNSSGSKLAHIKNLVPLDGTRVIEFSDYLSSYGELRFRVQTKDPLASEDIFKPYQYHVRLFRDDVVVWAGVIINNPRRNHEFIEVEAKTYEYLMTKVQVKHTDGSNPPSRIFQSGTMATAVTAIVNEGIAIGNSPISDFTLGTITNPDYPWAKGTAWTFTTTYSMEFVYTNLFQVISSFADASNADFMLTDDKVFSFAPRLGRDRTDISLRYGRGGNVSNYDAPLDGTNLTNDLVVFSWDKPGTNIIPSNAMDSSTFPTYGRLWRSIYLDDQLEQHFLDAKRTNIFKLEKDPASQISLILNEKAMPIGTYTLGDTISINITDGPISVNKTVRVIGWRCFITNTGVESVNILTNQ